MTHALTRRAVLLAAAFGTIGWFIAAMFIRFALSLGWFGAGPRLVLFAAAVPAAWFLVEVVRRIAPAHLLERVTVLCVTALLLDGLALVWFPALYGAEGAALLTPAA